LPDEQTDTVESSRMSSPLTFALTRLEESRQSIQSQSEGLRAGHEPDIAQLHRSLLDAYEQAEVLSNLIRVQRPRVSKIIHGSLDAPLRELKNLRQIQRRRLKLLALATELQAGRVEHHRLRRTEALNELRLQAVRELLELATAPLLDEILPGPNAAMWLHWARGLQETADAAVLKTLRRDFPALEELIAEIDERHWVSGKNPVAEFSSEEEEEATEEPVAEPLTAPPPGQVNTQTADHDRLARDMVLMVEKVLHPERSAGASPSDQDQAFGAAHTSPKPQAARSNETDVRQSWTSGDEAEDTPLWVVPRIDNGPTVNRSARVERKHTDKSATHDFMKVVNAWRLNDGQARELLGVSRPVFRQMREGKHVQLSPEKVTRISILVAIFKGLTVLYGTRRGDRWVHRPNSNPLFEGVEPLKYMLKQGVDGLVKVRQLVGVWSGYITPGGKG